MFWRTPLSENKAYRKEEIKTRDFYCNFQSTVEANKERARKNKYRRYNNGKKGKERNRKTYEVVKMKRRLEQDKKKGVINEEIYNIQ